MPFPRNVVRGDVARAVVGTAVAKARAVGSSVTRYVANRVTEAIVVFVAGGIDKSLLRLAVGGSQRDGDLKERLNGGRLRKKRLVKEIREGCGRG